MKAPARVYLLAAHELTLEAISTALEAAQGVSQVGAAKDLRQALRDLANLDVDVVVIEASDGDRESALARVRELADAHPRLKVLPLGLSSPRQAVSFLEAGAGGYVMKEDPWSRVPEVIEEVLRGRAACAPRVAALVYARLAELSSRERRGQIARKVEKLSARETQVLRLVASGLRNKEIARRLGITMSTAANHVQKVLGKLGVHRRRDAIRRACSQGILDGSMLPRSA